MVVTAVLKSLMQAAGEIVVMVIAALFLADARYFASFYS
jgi:hypothetical protein